MNKLVILTAFSLIFPAISFAQSVDDPQDIVKDPLCFKVRNEAPYNVYGNFVTDYYQTEGGIMARHRSNFRLDAAGSKDAKGQPSDAAEFCSYGPFLPGRKLELVLRTLVPIFDCKTKIDQGDIVIKGFQNADGLGTKTYAECFE